jgi:TRAP-type C4-dicarboxylate transport system permease large subunit
MDVFVQVRISLWLCALGVVVLYASFTALAAISPTEVAGVTAIVAGLATLVTIRNLRVKAELADPGGDPRVRRSLNRQRERRGF